MKLDDLAAKLIKLDNDIKYLVSASRFDWYDDLSGIEDWEAVTEDPNKLQFMKEFIGVMRKLQDVSWTMDYNGSNYYIVGCKKDITEVQVRYRSR